MWAEQMQVLAVFGYDGGEVPGGVLPCASRVTRPLHRCHQVIGNVLYVYVCLLRGRMSGVACTVMGATILFESKGVTNWETWRRFRW
jgi:hypothetical protein